TIPPPGVAPGAEIAKPEHFPTLQDDVALADSVLPAWMGIQFDAASDAKRARTGVGPGAVSVLTVYPDSPAGVAGLHPRDVIIGPPGAPFREREEVREWTMLSTVDQPRPLELMRGPERLRVTVVPKAMPGRWPKPPGPPKPGTAAPALELGSYRGTPPTTLA